MEPMEPLYTETGITSGDRHNGGTIALADGTLGLTLMLPTELGGPGGVANPEQLFALGYAACFNTALKVACRRKGKPVNDSTVTAKVTIGRTPDGSRETSLSLAVELIATVPELSAAEVRELLDDARELCPYSKATRGNIPVTLSVG